MKKGFTLAEVLLALAIIGVIAAITLPGLRTRLGDRKTNAWHAKYCHIMDAAVGQLWVDLSLDGDSSPLTQITPTNLDPYLQVNTGHVFKDGSSYSAAGNGSISVTFPEDAKISSATYTVSTVYEGIDCKTYMNGLNH